MHSERYLFVRVFARKMLNFLPEVMIWWMLKICFLEIVNTLLELWGGYKLLLHHCSTASNLEFEILKHDKIWGTQLALSPPHFEFFVLFVPRDLRPCRIVPLAVCNSQCSLKLPSLHPSLQHPSSPSVSWFQYHQQFDTKLPAPLPCVNSAGNTWAEQLAVFHL